MGFQWIILTINVTQQNWFDTINNFPFLNISVPETGRNLLQKFQCLFFRSFLDVDRTKINCLQCVAVQTTPSNHHRNLIGCHRPPTSPVYLLEINKSWFVCVQQESPSVGTDWVPADVWLGVFELLFHIFDHCLAVEAQEGSTDQLWMDRVGTNHLPADAQQGANFCWSQFSNSVSSRNSQGLNYWVNNSRPRVLRYNIFSFCLSLRNCCNKQKKQTYCNIFSLYDFK